MLNSLKTLNQFKILQTLALGVLISLTISCVPQATGPVATVGNSSQNNPNPTTTTYGEPTYPMSGIFIQEGAVQSAAQVALPLNFVDSFLVRGKDLSQYLRRIPNTTQFCLVAKYSYVPGNDKFLILSGKPKSYTDLVKKTTEFYLQVEPSNDQANQNDCLTYNLTNTLFTGATVPSASFSLSQLCVDCIGSVTSGGLQLYFGTNGEIVPNLNLSLLNITIAGSTSTSGTTCVESTSCQARGFNCCLNGQCVTDGAVRPGAISDAGFASAQEDVRLNPTRFIIYPQYYFICASRPSGTGGSTTPDPVDPAYDAAIRLMELTQLYQCLNKVDGEFSYCTVKFLGASTNIASNIPFSASSLGYKDDVNYINLNPYLNVNNIVKVFYAGQTLYEFNKTPFNPLDGNFVVSTANDNLTSAQSVLVKKAFPANAQDDNLYLSYKVDGTCEKLSTSLAKCTKTYIQGSTDQSNTTWHDTSKVYKLPSYADLSSTASLVVKISGIVIPEDTTTWSRSTNQILFNGSYPIYQNQKIEITYFVTSGVSDLVNLRINAQASVNSMCICGNSGKCNLKPVYDAQSNLTNYECVYPTVLTDNPPANQTVYVSNKSIPHRYYDSSGVNYDTDFASAPVQELTAFTYNNNDVLKPNNVSQYIGFNEIYGSFAKNGTQNALPAKLVNVKKDTSYDILVNSGVFSSCLTCGADYYTSLQKIFPQNFSGKGGGYSPNFLESRRSSNTSLYRSDDLLYGRACFVPVTMIPWTHMVGTEVKDQRRSRLAGQHFLFANGYTKDWYGFDYGSLIGSFDGVAWFSIGNERRIKAKTGKLFLAVNAYFGDLNIDNNFSVTVSETTSYSSSIPDHDTETDGAECQKAHFCSTDNDCFRQLGYEYSCQNVASMTTAWPQFDATGSEAIGSISKTLASIVGGTNGQSKRCVYRGKGAPCHADLTAPLTGTFNGSQVAGAVACSSNNMCQSFVTGSTTRFNDRISRFANTPQAQNLAVAASTVSDIVGLGARIIGRPFTYYGDKAIPALAKTNLTANNVASLCIPGKNIQRTSTTTLAIHNSAPTVRTDSSDKILGIGATLSGTALDLKYLSVCPATDSTGTYMQTSPYALDDNSSLTSATITQNMSTNLLDLPALVSQNIFSSTSGSQVLNIGYQRNACLRAPGASCFSDMDCAPSEFIASKAKIADLSSVLNAAEEKFWEEGLVCGNKDLKVSASFSIKNNLCCREIGNTLSVYTETDTSAHHWCDPAATPSPVVKVAGVKSINTNSINRYSRVHTAYDKMTCVRSEVGASKTYALSVKADTPVNRFLQIANQFKTLDTINQRTCCTGEWVRSFNSTDNGGGHQWAKGKAQTIDKSIFKYISWATQTIDPVTNLDTGQPFLCSGVNGSYATSACEVKSFTAAEEKLYLEWVGSLELIGIPQVAIKTNDTIFKNVDDNQYSVTSLKYPLDHTIVDINDPGSVTDFIDPSAKEYYSAASYSNFKIGPTDLKKVFSENEFNCCLPANVEVPSTTVATQCCTGFLANINGPLRCCLPDFTDVSVYLNRYVSSEGRGLPDSAYDSLTGYIKDAGQVQYQASLKNLCCSGKAVTGRAISNLSRPIAGDPTTGPGYLPKDASTVSRRFVYRDDAVDNNDQTGAIGSIYDAGVRWNNHVYCVPSDFPAEVP